MVHSSRARAYVWFAAAFAAIVYLTHLRYLDLPYYWDELGQFVPAALDIFQRGAWVPQRTIPNIHPPGLMAYLASVWTAFGYSVAATRSAMLALGSAAAFVAFLLAIELSKGHRGAPALAAILLLLCSPLFYTQAMLAELDLPAMLLASAALLCWLQARRRTALAACVALVLVKETGLAVPLALAAFDWREGRRQYAALLAGLPAAALGAWIAFLWVHTGHPMGNREFTDFNLFFPLHPVRLGGAVIRRIVYLGFENLHFLGWIFVALAWRKGAFRTRVWKVAGTVALVQVLVVTVFGGAVLERYLMPALPIMYAAFAVALPRPAVFVQAAALLACLFWNPPWPYPYENNLAMVDFVRLQQAAAEYVSIEAPDATVTTAWPLTAALWLPELGYVRQRVHIQRLADFRSQDLERLDPDSVRLFVLFSRDWQRPLDLRRAGWMGDLISRVYRWSPPVGGEEIERRFRLKQIAYWERGGQWSAIYAR